MPALDLSFDDIKLPEEDANKKADIKPDADDVAVPDNAAKPAESNDAQPATPAAADNAAQPDNTANSDAPPAENKGDEKVPPATDGGEPDKKADPVLTPFHEHPDWKKMQERVRAAEEEVQRVKQANAQPDPYAGLSVTEITKKLIAQKIEKEKWEPKDQLELAEAWDAKKAEAQKIVDERNERTQSESTAKAKEQIEDKLTQLNITDQAEKDKVIGLVRTWASQGLNVSIQAFDIAAENLRLKGEIGRPGQAQPVSTPQPAAVNDEENKKQEATKQAQADANRKIARSKPAGEQSPKSKISYKELHGKDLDTIVLEQAQRLG